MVSWIEALTGLIRWCFGGMEVDLSILEVDWSFDWTPSSLHLENIVWLCLSFIGAPKFLVPYIWDGGSLLLFLHELDSVSAFGYDCMDGGAWVRFCFCMSNKFWIVQDSLRLLSMFFEILLSMFFWKVSCPFLQMHTSWDRISNNWCCLQSPILVPLAIWFALDLKVH